MKPEPIDAALYRDIALLLGQLDPTPSAEWVALETDRIVRRFEDRLGCPAGIPDPS